MKADGGGAPTGKVAEMIDRNFGSYDKFKSLLNSWRDTVRFWLGLAVLNGGKLEVRKTPNAETPLTEDGVTPLLTMDVWEHAYYLDYQNARPKYIETFLDELVNWDFANQNLADA